MPLLRISLLACLFGMIQVFGQPLKNTRVTSLPGEYHLVDNLYLSGNKRHFLFHNSNKDPSRTLPKADRAFYSHPADTFLQKSYVKNVVPISGLSLFLFERGVTKHFETHYYHILEHLLGAWCFYLEDKTHAVKNILIASDGKSLMKNFKGPNQINFQLLRALFPNAKISTLRSCYPLNRFNLLHFEKALLSDRHLTDFHPRHCPKEVHLASDLDTIRPSQIESFAKTLRQGLSIRQESSKKLRVTFVLRDPPRRLNPQLRNRFFTFLRSLKGVDFKAVDFAKMSYREQIKTATNTDILIGVHGNGLSHLIALPKHAMLIEIFPSTGQTFHYSHLAEAKQITYFRIQNGAILSESEALEKGLNGNLSHEVDVLDFQLIKDLIYSCSNT